MSGPFRHFDGMCWPVPGERLDALEWSLRYGSFHTVEELMLAASVVSAYRQLVELPHKECAKRVREIRKGT